MASDFMLLLMKAAVVASAQVGERLLPFSPPPVEDWTEEDEMVAEIYRAEQAAKSTTIPDEIQIS